MIQLPSLCWSVVDPALFGLGLEHVLADNGGYLVNLILHLLNILDGWLEKRWLLGQANPGVSSQIRA